MASVFTQFCGINYAKIKLKGGIMAYLTCLEEKELESLSGIFQSSQEVLAYFLFSNTDGQGGQKPGAGPLLPAFPRTF